MSKPKYIVEEITETVKVFKPTSVCPECDSLLVIEQYGLYEEAVCMAGCGYTETTKPRQPADI